MILAYAFIVPGGSITWVALLLVEGMRVLLTSMWYICPGCGELEVLA